MGADEHSSLVGAHEERFITLFKRLEKVEVTTEDHVKDSTERIRMIDRHEMIISDWNEFRKELRAWALGIIVTLFLGTLWLGGRFNSLDKLERIHEKEMTSSFNIGKKDNGSQMPGM